jgi:hypothetical protein
MQEQVQEAMTPAANRRRLIEDRIGLVAGKRRPADDPDVPKPRGNPDFGRKDDNHDRGGETDG